MTVLTSPRFFFLLGNSLKFYILYLLQYKKKYYSHLKVLILVKTQFSTVQNDSSWANNKSGHITSSKSEQLKSQSAGSTNQHGKTRHFTWNEDRAWKTSWLRLLSFSGKWKQTWFGTSRICCRWMSYTFLK